MQTIIISIHIALEKRLEKKPILRNFKFNMNIITICKTYMCCWVYWKSKSKNRSTHNGNSVYGLFYIYRFAISRQWFIEIPR